jgi:hypothetical protein
MLPVQLPRVSRARVYLLEKRVWSSLRSALVIRVRVTSVAGQGEVCRIIISAMLTGNDVLDLERRKRQVFLPEQTMFAAIAGPLTDKFTDRCAHQLGGRRARMARAFACKKPIRSIAST